MQTHAQVFLGDQSVGKTSIITRFMYDKFDNTYQVGVWSWGGLAGAAGDDTAASVSACNLLCESRCVPLCWCWR
jgi:GTPase SAR1 family protein